MKEVHFVDQIHYFYKINETNLKQFIIIIDTYKSRRQFHCQNQRLVLVIYFKKYLFLTDLLQHLCRVSGVRYQNPYRSASKFIRQLSLCFDTVHSSNINSLALLFQYILTIIMMNNHSNIIYFNPLDFSCDVIYVSL